MAVVFTHACTTSREVTNQSSLAGKWKARWDTDPAAFPGVQDISVFTMDGYFEFTEEGDVTVTAFGFPGCIFSTDTLSHSLNWKLSNDTLSLINPGDQYGMIYRVNDLQEQEVKLQLMDDIFVTLTKP